MKELSPLERAVQYIEEHLDENIGLYEVSRETGYSYYYMTRLFSSVLGESVGRYIKRRRLYNASEKLIYTSQKVIDIALASGFETAEAFSRAFKAAFGSSPIAYRRKGRNLVVNAKRTMAPDDVFHIANNISRSPEVVILEERKVAGIRGMTSLSDNRIPALWEQFLRLYSSLVEASGMAYGICETQQAIYTEAGDVLYSVMVGSPVTCFDSLSPKLASKTISGGRYAVFTHQGTLAHLFQTYQYIFGTWLPLAGVQLDDREDFEVYDREVVSFDDPNNQVKIYIPIK